MSDQLFIKMVPQVSGVARVTICASERRNALSAELLKSLVDAIAEVSADAECRVVIVSAEGPHFCAGWDVSDFARLSSLNESQVEDDLRQSHSSFQTIRNVPAVTIGAIRGTVAGAGVGLLNALHINIASKNIRVALPEVGYGIVPAGVMVDLLSIPSKAALDLLVTGEPINGERVHQLGLVSRMVEDDELDAETERIAALIASYPANVVRSILNTYIAISENQDDESFSVAYKASARSVTSMTATTKARK